MHIHIIFSLFANCIVELVIISDSKYIKIYDMNGRGALIDKTKQNYQGPWKSTCFLVLYMFHMYLQQI